MASGGRANCRAQSLYCAIGLATRRNPCGLAKRRNKAIAPYDNRDSATRPAARLGAAQPLARRVGRNRFIAPSASPRAAIHGAWPSGAIKRLRPTITATAQVGPRLAWVRLNRLRGA
jgi:hypothetical protein